jgi:GDSL-like Lipase/Acylhydrolase family
MKTILSRALIHGSLLVASALVALVVGEASLRLLDVSYPVFDDYDEKRGFRLRPGKQGWYRAEGEAYLSINSLGYRDREHDRAKPGNTFRIAVLGDSFVEARQVPLEQAFWHRLGHRLETCHFANGKDIEMLNFGIGGYNTSQEYLTLQKDVLGFQPDIVLLAFFAGNDLEGNWRKPKEAGVWRINAPTHKLDGDQLIPNAELRPSIVQRLLYEAVHYSRLIELVNEARRRIRALTWRASEPNGIEAGLNPVVFMPPATQQWHEAWLVTETLLAKMNSLVRNQGAQFVVATVPSATEVDPIPERREHTASRLGIDDFLYPDRAIADIGAKSGFHVFPLTKELQQLAERRGLYMHGFENTRIGFGHLNEKGHELVAQILAEKLCHSPLNLVAKVS